MGISSSSSIGYDIIGESSFINGISGLLVTMYCAEAIYAEDIGLCIIVGVYAGCSDMIADTLIVPVDYFSIPDSIESLESPSLPRNPYATTSAPPLSWCVRNP